MIPGRSKLIILQSIILGCSCCGVEKESCSKELCVRSWPIGATGERQLRPQQNQAHSQPRSIAYPGATTNYSVRVATSRLKKSIIISNLAYDGISYTPASRINRCQLQSLSAALNIALMSLCLVPCPCVLTWKFCFFHTSGRFASIQAYCDRSSCQHSGQIPI